MSIRQIFLSACTAIAALGLHAGAGLAQVTRVPPDPRPRVVERDVASRISILRDTPRAVVGIATTSSTTAADTLGVEVVEVTADGPAAKAGIREGQRIAAVNGVNLRLAPADIGDRLLGDVMARRLSRELDRVKPGDEVELRIVDGPSQRTLRIRTVDSEDLYATRVRRATAGGFGAGMMPARADADRASLGITLGVNGSRRDTLGVFVMGVTADGPAARAGIEEGARLQAINDVDLRVDRADAGDPEMAQARLRRLTRELERVKPGDVVRLRVHANGQTRTVQATAVRASELPRTRSRIIIGDGGAHGGMMLDVDGAAIGLSARRAIERAMESAGRGLEGTGRMLDEIGRGLGGSAATVRWFDDRERPIILRDAPSRSRIRME